MFCFLRQEDLILQNICYLDSKATQTAVAHFNSKSRQSKTKMHEKTAGFYWRTESTVTQTSPTSKKINSERFCVCVQFSSTNLCQREFFLNLTKEVEEIQLAYYFFYRNVKRLITTANGNMNFVTLLVIGTVLQIALSNLKTWLFPLFLLNILTFL